MTPSSLTARGRMLSVVTIVVVGAMGVISSTQTWLVVTLADGAAHDLTVAGAAAVPVLAPLSLATLALGAALSIVGTVVRFVFGVLTVAIAGVMTWLTAVVTFTMPTAAVAATVTEATGISGQNAVAGMVLSTTGTPWPAITLVLWVGLLIAGVFTLATAHRWRGSGRRYRTDAEGAEAAASRPRDAIDSWDDLSRGDDPTR